MQVLLFLNRSHLYQASATVIFVTSAASDSNHKLHLSLQILLFIIHYCNSLYDTSRLFMHLEGVIGAQQQFLRLSFETVSTRDQNMIDTNWHSSSVSILSSVQWKNIPWKNWTAIAANIIWNNMWTIIIGVTFLTAVTRHSNTACK